MTSDVMTTPAFTDRRGGLIFFGILQLALGAGALLMTAVMILSLMVASAGPAGAPRGALQLRVLIPVGGLYLGVAAWFIVLGVATMLPRRWAWALTVVQSWLWLVFGVTTTAMMLFMGGRFLPAMPPGQEGARAFAIGCMAAVMGVFLVVLPIAFVLFFRSPNVKATVWARDPHPRWTDAIPLSVLGGGLLMIASAPTLLMSAGSYRAVPVGTIIVGGWAAAAGLLVTAAVAAFSGVQLLRLRRSGWWGTLVFILIGVVVGASFIMLEPSRWSGVLVMDNLPRAQYEQIIGMYRSPVFYGWLAVVWAAYAAYLVYIRRYFFSRTTSLAE